MSISSVDSAPLHVKQEINLNLSTEANRILFVLNKIVARAKFVGVLKELIREHGKLLREYLDESSITHILQQCFKFPTIPDRQSSTDVMNSSLNSSQKQKSTSDRGEFGSEEEEEESDDVSISAIDVEPDRVIKADIKEKRKYDGLNEIIYMLEGMPEIRQLAQTLENTLSPEMKHFVNSLTEFKSRMEVQLFESADQFKTRERYMREIYEKNEVAKREIERLEEELLVTKTDANVCLIGRNILIKRHLNKIDKIQRNSQEAIEKRVNESEKAMVNSWKASVATQDGLRRDLQHVTEKYDTMLKDHLGMEKALRGKRAKLEHQVLGWIQKFDQDIGDKQAEEEKIQALLDEESREVNEIQKKINEQEEEYDELMQEKAEYEEEMIGRRLRRFILNRSARRIQRSFRLYKARKLAKKLAKKEKKAKKKSKNKKQG